MKEEGSELSQNMGQLKLPAEDGKMRMTDVADTEQLFLLRTGCRTLTIEQYLVNYP